METPTGWRLPYTRAHIHTRGYLCNYYVIAYKITPAHTRTRERHTKTTHNVY